MDGLPDSVGQVDNDRRLVDLAVLGDGFRIIVGPGHPKARQGNAYRVVLNGSVAL